MSKSYNLLVKFIDKFFNIGSLYENIYVAKKIKELFKKKFWKNKKRIKNFFNEIDILLNEEYDLYTKKQWNSFVHNVRLFLEKRKIKKNETYIFLFRKLRFFEKTCYENSYPENLSEELCLDCKTNKSIICRKCGSERFMYLQHCIEGNSSCKRCNKKIFIFYEKCC